MAFWIFHHTFLLLFVIHSDGLYAATVDDLPRCFLSTEKHFEFGDQRTTRVMMEGRRTSMCSMELNAGLLHIARACPVSLLLYKIRFSGSSINGKPVKRNVVITPPP